jgi:hypothetical protein
MRAAIRAAYSALVADVKRRSASAPPVAEAVRNVAEDSIVVEEGSIASAPSTVREKDKPIYDAALEPSLVVEVSFGDASVPSALTAGREG